MKINQALITGTILTGAGIYKTWKDYNAAPREQKERILIRNTAALGTAALAVFSIDRFMQKRFSSDILQNFSHRISSAILNNKFVKKITGKLIPQKELQPVKFQTLSNIIADCTNDVMLTTSAAIAGITAGFLVDKTIYKTKEVNSNNQKNEQTQPESEPATEKQTKNITPQNTKNEQQKTTFIDKITNEKTKTLFLDTAQIFENAGLMENPLGKTTLVLSSLNLAKEKNLQTIVEQTATGIVAEALIPTLFVSIINSITGNKSMWVKIPAIATAFYAGNFVGEKAGTELTHEIRDELFDIEDENEEEDDEEIEETNNEDQN